MKPIKAKAFAVCKPGFADLRIEAIPEYHIQPRGILFGRRETVLQLRKPACAKCPQGVAKFIAKFRVCTKFVSGNRD
jgi:hypothetical protein